MSIEKLLLLGRDHGEFGKTHLSSLYEVEAAISAGASPQSPSMVHKGDKDWPNEDALLVLKEGTRWLLAVADGHHGASASHLLLQGIAASCEFIPQRLSQLSLMLATFDWDDLGDAGTTLLLACVDTQTRQVFGLSFGDSTLAEWTPGRLDVKNRHNDVFLRQGSPVPVESAEAFDFKWAQDTVLLAYSDGVNECCYREPLRSVQGRHLMDLGDHPAQHVAEVALHGVDGNPGGQDNIVVVALSR